MSSAIDARELLAALILLHDQIRDAVVAACERAPTRDLAQVAHDDEGDTIYAIDRVGEDTLVVGLASLAAREPLVLIAEGIAGGTMVLPPGASAADAHWRIIVDPIDGTRGLMYQKRPAWVLSAAAPNQGETTSIRDCVLAVQTEIPLIKQHQSDQLSCLRGEGVTAERIDRVRGTRHPIRLAPSCATTIAHGFASIARFFPGGREILASIDDEIATAMLGPRTEAKAACFEDQYLSTAGQLYELMAGHDRFIADLRPLISAAEQRAGRPGLMCCHPYDICTLMIAEELGVVVRAPDGGPLDAPLNVEADVAWAGYANPGLAARLEPILRGALDRRGLRAGGATTGPAWPAGLRDLRDHFEPGEVFVARAPGRLDVMGGIADYSGSLVLQLPLADATWCAVQARADQQLELVSLPSEPGAPPRVLSVDRRSMLPLALTDPAALRTWCSAESDRAWAGYVLGILAVWHRDLGFVAPHGFKLVIASDVPEGKGVSPSAALEVAAATALAALFGIARSPTELALDCQRVENLVVGAACGVMDQMTASCGEEQHLLKLLCQPATIEGQVGIPDGLRFWGIDSGVRHSVAGSDYTSVRIGAFMGHRILAEAAGAHAEHDGDRVWLSGDPFLGYLANVTVRRVETEFAGLLPETMTGGEFLARFGGTIDRATRVDPHRTYPVRMPTVHPIREHERVRRFASLLRERGAGAAVELGRLMLESHAGYSACGLGSAATDQLVDLVRAAGPAPGLFGARITGGGSGGTVAILGRADAEATVREVAARYAAATGRPSRIFAGSSPGAAAFGIRRLTIS